MSVVAKFRVEEILQTQNWTGKDTRPLSSIKLVPVYDSNPDSENGKFFAATPSGKIEIGTINPDAASQFEVGREYFITFNKA